MNFVKSSLFTPRLSQIKVFLISTLPLFYHLVRSSEQLCLLSLKQLVEFINACPIQLLLNHANRVNINNGRGEVRGSFHYEKQVY